MNSFIVLWISVLTISSLSVCNINESNEMRSWVRAISVTVRMKCFRWFLKKDTDKTCQYFTGLSISFCRRIPAVARKFGDVQNEARRVTVLLLSSELEITSREELDHTLMSATIWRKKTLNRQNKYALPTLNYQMHHVKFGKDALLYTFTHLPKDNVWKCTTFKIC